MAPNAKCVAFNFRQFDQLIKNRPADQRFKAGAYVNIGRRLLRFGVNLKAQAMFRAGFGEIANIGFKTQNLLLPGAADMQQSGDKRRVFNLDADFLNRRHQIVLAVLVMAQNSRE